MSRRKLPIAVAHAINQDDKQLLSILGRAGAKVSGQRRSEGAAWRRHFKERQQAEFEAAAIAARHEELRLHGLDHRLPGAYPDHANDPDYELELYA